MIDFKLMINHATRQLPAGNDLFELLRAARLTRPVAVFDFETNGLDPVHCQPIEVAVARLEPDGKLTTWNALIKCDQPLPPKITELTRITDAMLADKGLPYLSAMNNTWKLLDHERTTLVGHNAAKFDYRFLMAWGSKVKVEVPALPRFFWDTAGAYKAEKLEMKKPEGESWFNFHITVLNRQKRGLGYKLADCCTEHGIVLDGAHRAAADVEATLRLFLKQAAALRQGKAKEAVETIRTMTP